MAKAALSLPYSGLSGSLGDTIIVQRPDGPVVRRRAYKPRRPTPAQEASAARMALVAQAWARLDDATFAAWGRYALARAYRNPATGAIVTPKAFNLYSGLANKARQVDPSVDLSAFGPPERAFLGDGVAIELLPPGAGGGDPDSPPPAPSSPGTNPPGREGGSLVAFAADRANAPGVVTELLAQPLANRRRATYKGKYVSAGFHAFPGAEAFEAPLAPGAWACAYRFVRAGTGQETEIVELGVVVVPA